MIVAAMTAMTIGLNAATFTPVDCYTTPNASDECPTLVFKLTANGKAVDSVGSESYKAVKTLKVRKGALAFVANADCASEGFCCYDTMDLYATVKIGNETKQIGITSLSIDKWSVFGKNFEKASNYLTSIKPGKSVKLDSDLFVSGEDLDTLDEEDAISLFAAAFGEFSLKVSKASTSAKSGSYCVATYDSPGCDPIWTPKTYSGWFVGYHNLTGDDYSCFNCECGEYDIFGGTWKATYQPKLTSDADAQKLAFNKVLFSDEDANEEEE